MVCYRGAFKCKACGKKFTYPKPCKIGDYLKYLNEFRLSHKNCDVLKIDHAVLFARRELSMKEIELYLQCQHIEGMIIPKRGSGYAGKDFVLNGTIALFNLN